MPATPAFRASTLLWQLLHGAINLRISRPMFPWPPLKETVSTAVELILPNLFDGFDVA